MMSVLCVCVHDDLIAFEMNMTIPAKGSYSVTCDDDMNDVSE